MHAIRMLGLAVLLGGCPDRTIAEVPVNQDTIEVKDVAAVPRNDVDILFVIDDSMSMQDEQTSLKANFPRLVGVLETIQTGLPDVQIGVITPNMGTTATDGTTNPVVLGSCNGDGENGLLRELSPGGPRFLQSFDNGAGGRTTNFTGTLADAFTQLASVGSNGCGVEQHLEAMLRATDGTNPQNAPFLRDSAYLAVIIIADEDDCSLAKSTLFDEPQGPMGFSERINHRCTKQGVVCDTPGTPLDQTGPRMDCHPRTDDSEVEVIERYVDHLKSLKPDPRDVMVAGITGNPDQFVVETRNGTAVLANSCPAGSGGDATPAVRMAAFVDQFTLNTRSTICDGDLSDGLEKIGALIKQGLDDVCFENDLLDVDPATDGPQYSCSVVEVRRRPGQTDQELRTLARCETGQFPCWRIEEDAAKCFYTAADPHLKLVIDYNGEVAGADIHIKSQCVTTDSAGNPL